MESPKERTKQLKSKHKWIKKEHKKEITNNEITKYNNK